MNFIDIKMHGSTIIKIHELLLRMYNFLDNRLVEVHSLRRVVNGFLFVLSTFLLRCGYISVQAIRK